MLFEAAAITSIVDPQKIETILGYSSDEVRVDYTLTEDSGNYYLFPLHIRLIPDSLRMKVLKLTKERTISNILGQQAHAVIVF